MFAHMRVVLASIGILMMAGFADPVKAGALPENMEKPGGFPERALVAVVPYGPAGGSAQFARALAEAVTRVTGVPIEMQYRNGASGSFGMASYMASRADGYTVLEHIDDAAAAHAMSPSRPNPAEDLIPLMIGQITFSQIYIRSDEKRFTDWSSFVAYAKKHKGRVTVANITKAGSMERLNLKFVADHLGIELEQISLDRAAYRYLALEREYVDALFEQPGDISDFLDSGKFKPILTFLEDRSAAFPDVPAFKDIGLNRKPLMRYRGYYVHKDAPPERVEWLKWAFQKAFSDKDYQAFNREKYMDLVDSFRDTDGARKLIKENIEIYRKTYKELGLIF